MTVFWAPLSVLLIINLQLEEKRLSEFLPPIKSIFDIFEMFEIGTQNLKRSKKLKTEIDWNLVLFVLKYSRGLGF